MADLKISALTASTTPLAGTEVLPIVQSSTTKQVSVANLTAGRVVSNLASVSTGANGAVVGATNGLVTDFSGSNSRIFASRNGVNASSLQIWTTDSLGSANNTFDFTSDGNLKVNTSGKGIDFSATPGTGTSELLADYEEGTWTPIDGSAAGLTFTLLANSAKYTKIGRMVTATFALSYPATAAAGQATIGGLPFTSGTGAGQGGYIVYTSLTSIPGLNVSPSSTIFYPYAGSGTGFSNASMSGQDLRGVVIYFV